jgi:MSHA pilin protein MshD
MCTAEAPRRARGFTLPELLLIIVVLGIGLSGIVTAFTTMVGGSADPLVRRQAMAVAEALMEEIMAQAYNDPGTAPGATRESFDSITDYNGYSTAGVKNFSGVAIPELANYNVAVTVGGATVVNGATAKLVTVTVTGPGPAGAFTLQGYKASY